MQDFPATRDDLSGGGGHRRAGSRWRLGGASGFGPLSATSLRASSSARSFGLGTETQDLQHFAEFGVVMMLFLIGLELDPVRCGTCGTGSSGSAGRRSCLTTGGGDVPSPSCMAFHWQTSLAIGMVLALSSTAIVLQNAE